jgi:hypothetical protein
LLLVAGVQYLLVRARKIRVFGGIDLQTDAGWVALKASLRASAQLLFATLGAQPVKPAAGAAKKARLRH